MKSRIYIVMAVLWSFSAGAQFPNAAGVEGSLTNKYLLIKQGEHYNEGFDRILDMRAIKLTTVNRQMEFQWEFKSNTLYNGMADYGGDWNKLALITFVYSDWREFCTRSWEWEFDFLLNVESNFKMHTAWRYNEEREKMELALFFHNDYYWTAHYLRDANENSFGNPWEVTQHSQMHLGKGVIGMAGGGVALGVRRETNFFASTRQSYLRKQVYFGGDGTAPHEMGFFMHHIRYDGEDDNPFSKRFNDSENQQWNLTTFRPGDHYFFHAANTMTGSSDLTYGDGYPVVAKCQHHSDQRKAFCILRPESRIEFKAGKRVLLKPGFHAEKGSVFRGRIAPKSKKSPIPMTPFDDGQGDSNSEDEMKKMLKELRNSGMIENYVVVLPNPADEFFNVRNGLPMTLNVDLFSMDGNHIESFEVNRESQFDFNCSRLRNGLYLAKISFMREQVLNKKILISH